ncbi:MAG: hypothetical protein GY796_09260, partial [Chloroflexi bacterium]|nr:hypothetical protein [Chloroflexota bacterium]
MNDKVIIGIVITVLALALSIAAVVTWGVVGLIGVLIVLAIVAIVTFFQQRKGYVRLNELEVGVLFDRHGNFICFLDNEYGRVYPQSANKPNHCQPLDNPIRRHAVNPAQERMTATISKGLITATGTAKQIRTLEGIPIDIPWSFAFRIEVCSILSGIELKMARALPEFSTNIIAGRVKHALQHIISCTPIADLYAFEQGDDDDDGRGPIQRLEDELCVMVMERSKILGITGSGLNDVRLGPIELPAQLEKALRAAHQRQLQTETMGHALEVLQKAVSNFSEEDMQRLTTLERLRIIDENSKSMVYVTDAFVSSKSDS